jgi:hypothetical protein
MSNLLRSLSFFIGGRADAAPVRGSTQTSAAHTAAPVEATPNASEPTEEPRPAAQELPLVTYVVPADEAQAPRPRRARSVSLLRSASAAAVSTRTMPMLPSVATRQTAHPSGPALTETERVRLQVMQAQLQLTALRLYDGPIDGHMGPATATAVRHFQTLKCLRATGTLAAGTLAALGVPLIG